MTLEIKSVQDGASALLVEAADILANFPETNYIVIGGWCPYLRNDTNIPHPGTLDVELFFKDSYKEDSLKVIVEEFMRNGFIPSAKHEFQLLKSIKIKDQDLIFNIDLLHPMMVPDEGNDLFVKQLDLDVPYDSEEYRIKKIVSIVIPNSKVLFDENLYSTFNFRGRSINLMSFDGLLLTKMDSFKQAKRPRDSFDIYLGFKGNKIDIPKIRNLALQNKRVNKSLSGFLSELKDNGDKFNDNVEKFYSNKIVTENDPAGEILGLFKL